MWYVRGTYCGLVAWWGAYSDKKTAEIVAERVNGEVLSHEQVYNHA